MLVEAFISGTAVAEVDIGVLARLGRLDLPDRLDQRNAFMARIVGNSQALDGTAIGEAVRCEIHRPDFVRARRADQQYWLSDHTFCLS